jgi:hypothetical protein
MSINACTTNSSSITSFCGVRRAVVLAGLIAKKYPSTSIASGSVGSAAKDIRTLPRPSVKDDETVLTFEQPFVTVQVEAFGKTYTQQLENSAQTEFVAITEVEIGSIEVNILELQVG